MGTIVRDTEFVTATDVLLDLIEVIQSAESGKVAASNQQSNFFLLDGAVRGCAERCTALLQIRIIVAL